MQIDDLNGAFRERGCGRRADAAGVDKATFTGQKAASGLLV